MKFLAALLVYLILAQNAGAVFISNTYIGGGGQAFAVHSDGYLVQLSQSNAQLLSAHLALGGYNQTLTKTGNEILSGYPFYYSGDNGASFAAQTVDLPSSGSGFARIASNGTTWVVIDGNLDTGCRVYSSTNRANWTQQANAGALATFATWRYLESIAYGDGKWVIKGFRNAVPQWQYAYSTDLISWTFTDGGITATQGDMAYGNGYFISWGTTASPGRIERASSGSLGSWSAVNLPFNTGFSLPRGAFSSVNNRWAVVAVYDSGGSGYGGVVKAAYSDDNGATWTESTVTGSFGYAPHDFQSIVALSGGGFIAVGRRFGGGGGMAAYSADGTEFVPIPNASLLNGLYGLVAQ